MGYIPFKTYVNMPIACNKHMPLVVRYEHIYKRGYAIASERPGSYHQQALFSNSIPSVIIDEYVNLEQGS
jgi:hypothetical protein